MVSLSSSESILKKEQVNSDCEEPGLSNRGVCAVGGESLGWLVMCGICFLAVGGAHNPSCRLNFSSEGNLIIPIARLITLLSL